MVRKCLPTSFVLKLHDLLRKVQLLFILDFVDDKAGEKQQPLKTLATTKKTLATTQNTL